MRALAALRDGARRVNGAPVLLAGMCALTLGIALPVSHVVQAAIHDHLGSSLASETVAAGADYGWWQEFTAQASGLAATFVPSIVGFGAVLDNLDHFLENRHMAVALAAVTAAWLLVWSFVSGGVLDRLARARPTRTAGFFAASGTHFWRFLRLGLLAWAAYSLLFGVVHGWIFDDAYGAMTRDMTVERTGFAVRMAGYALFGLLLVLVNVAFDFARVRIVVEDRRSAIGALAGGARFVWRHPGAVLGVYLLNGALFVLLVLAYALLSPGAPGDGLGAWAVLLLGQAYIVGRHYLKLLFYASEIALFQAALAHAAYTAAPVVVWPDSPAAESIANAEPALVP
jgi:hypothetical protein